MGYFFWAAVKEDHLMHLKLISQPLSNRSLRFGNILSRNKAIVSGCVDLNFQEIFLNDLRQGKRLRLFPLH